MRRFFEGMEKDFLGYRVENKARTKVNKNSLINVDFFKLFNYINVYVKRIRIVLKIVKYLIILT